MRSNRTRAAWEVAECYTPAHPRPEKPRLANAPLPVPDASHARGMLTGDADACANPYAGSRSNAYPNPYPCPHSYVDVNPDRYVDSRPNIEA